MNVGHTAVSCFVLTAIMFIQVKILKILKPINIQDTTAIKQIIHVLLLWVLEGKKHGDGLGFPFDRPHAEFYKRLILLWEQINAFQEKCTTNKPIFKLIARILDDLSPLVNDNFPAACREELQLIRFFPVSGIIF